MSGANASPAARSHQERTLRRRVGTIFWGVTLIVIGGLLLAWNLGYDIPIWGYVARYWPLRYYAKGLRSV